MGGSSSSVSNEYVKALETLISSNYKNEQFLDRIISAAPHRIEAPPVDPKILNSIATAQPDNIIGLLRQCVDYVEKLEESKSDLTADEHNKFSLVLQLFVTASTVLAHNPKLIKQFEELVVVPGSEVIYADEKPKKAKKEEKAAEPKKGKKAAKKVESDEDEEEEEEEEPEEKPKKKGKKGAKVEEEAPKKKGKKGAKQPEPEEKPKKKGKKAAKQPEPEEEEEEEEEPEEKPKKKGKKFKAAEPEPEEEKPKKKGKKGAKAEEPVEEEKPKKKGKKGAKADPEPEEEKPKKKGKKGAKVEEPEPEEEKPKKKGKKSAAAPAEEEKPKKKGKKAKVPEPEPEEEEEEEEEPEEKPKKKGKKAAKVEEEAPKKKGKKSKAAEPEPEEEKPKKKGKKSAAAPVEEEKPKKKGKKSKIPEPEPEEEEEEEEEPEEKPKKKGKKAAAKAEAPKKKGKKTKVVDSDEDEEEEEEEKPKAKKPSKKGKIVEQDESTTKVDRSSMSLLSRFTSSVFKCMFKSNITVTEKDTGFWSDISSTNENAALTRYDFVHTVLALTNIAAVAHPIKPLPRYTISVPPFRGDLFINSLCRIAANFVSEFNSGSITVYSAEMIKNCFALVADFATKDPLFARGFAKIDPEVAIQAFTGNPIQNELIFDPTSAFSSASLSFLYMMALNNPTFVQTLAKKDLSNRFIFDLIYTMQFSFEKVGVCYVHSILVSTLMLLLNDKLAVENLMQPQKQRLLVNFKPHSSTFVDLLIEIVLNLSKNESLLPSIVCLYHLISEHIKEISLFATFKLLTLFETIAEATLKDKSERNRRLCEIFMEGFVRNMMNGVNIRVLFVQKAPIFRKLESDDDLEFNSSLEAIVAFLGEAKKMMSKANKKTMGTEEAYEMFKGMDMEDVFEDIDVEFENHPHIFAGEMKKTWVEWSEMLSLKAYEVETNMLNQVQL